MILNIIQIDVFIRKKKKIQAIKNKCEYRWGWEGL